MNHINIYFHTIEKYLRNRRRTSSVSLGYLLALLASICVTFVASAFYLFAFIRSFIHLDFLLTNILHECVLQFCSFARETVLLMEEGAEKKTFQICFY